MAKNINRKVTIYINGKEVEATISSLTAKVRQLEAEQRKLPIGSQEYINKTMELKRLNGILQEQKRAVKDVGDSWKDTTFKLAEFSNILMGLQSAFQMIDMGIGKIKDLAKDAAQLDDIYADVMKTTGLTHEQVERLNEAFSKMDTRTSREQLNQLAYEAGKLGLAGEETVAQFVAASDKINIALGDVLGEGAMVTVGKMTQIYEASSKTLEGKNLEEKMLAIGSAINSLGQASTANEGYMVEFMKRLGGIAAQAGMSADQILGFASALDQQGQAVEMSATAMMKLIMQMTKKPEEFVQAAGMSIENFRKMMDEDMNGAVLRVLEGLNSKGGFQQLIGMFESMGLDGSRAAGVVSSLAKHIDSVREAQALANKEMLTGSSVMTEFNVKNNDMQAQAEKAKKRFQDMRIELGNELYPILIHLQKSGTVLMKGVAGMAQILKEQPAIIIPITAAIVAMTRAKIADFLASGKLGKAMGTLIGLGKQESVTTAFQEKSTRKLTARREAERLAILKSQLATEKENLARQQSSSMTELQRLSTITKNKVYQLEVAVTNQATVAEKAHAEAINASRAAFMAVPWGLIITALTSIGMLVAKAVRSTSEWKLKETLKDVAQQAGEAEGHIKVLFDRLKAATEGSNEYRKALEELKAEYPQVIAQHVNEKGELRDLEKAYQDLSKAARQSIYDRMYADKAGEMQGELGAELQRSIERSNKFIDRYLKSLTEAERTHVKQQANTILSELSAGTKSYREAYKEYTDLLHGYGNERTQFGRLDWLNDLYDKSEETKQSLEELRTALNPTDSDPFGLEKKSLEELNTMLGTSEKLLKGYEKAAGEGREGFAAKAETERQKIEALTAAIGRLRQSAASEDGGAGGGSFSGSTKESAEEKKARRAREAWERFEGNYNRLMERMGNKSKEGAAKVVADIDDALSKMRDDLEAVVSAHPEAEQMLDDLNAGATAWKKAQLDSYIEKMNAALAKQVVKLKEGGDEGNSYIKKMQDAQTKLSEAFASFDTATSQAQLDIETLQAQMADASEEEKANLQEQIKKLELLIRRYGELKGNMVAAVFDEIDTSKVKSSRLSGDESQWRDEVQQQVDEHKESGLGMLYNKADFDNYGRSLEAIYQKYEKQKAAIDEARKGNSAMLADLQKQAAADPTNTELQKRIELRQKEEERLKGEADALEVLKESAIDAAENDAFGTAIDRWIEGVEQFGQMATELWSGINTILNNITQKELNEAKAQRDEAAAELDAQLEQGLISQEDYNEELSRINEEYDQKEKELQLKQWRRQKALNIGTATMEGALAVLKALASAPPPYNTILAGIASALTAVQIAAIATEPEPYAKGGYVNGRTYMMAGEAGREWVASNKLLEDPRTAPIIQALEDFQRGEESALAAVPMSRLNTSVAMEAARELGRRSLVGIESSLSRQQPGTVNSPSAVQSESVEILRDLAQYLKDPRNRQAVISRRTMDDFEENEQFLRNRAVL